ncbi:pancreatic triacylglycerol lipase-like [Arctopsyche grandis]|uniref:pancreatic triacylglycerol lipase-like n=1 Tax=Arctopsyche grandis TaxID=121162 RepID=UPI00406D702F
MRLEKVSFVFVIFACSIQSIHMQLTLTTLLQSFMEAVSGDCTVAMQKMGLSYTSMATQANTRLANCSLKLYSDTDKFVYPLSIAANNITQSPYFKNGLKTVIIYHGYMGDSEGSFMLSLVKAIKAAGNANVLQYEHSSMTRDMYFQAVTLGQYAGEALGKVLANMYSLGVRNFHLIGLSLGAQVAAFTAKEFYKITGVKIEQLTGLDPSGPCYYKVPASQRLAKTDADFVDVIHTDLGVFGVSSSVGHVDFFPNSGSNMPGCWGVNLCNHVDSIIYYTESAFISKNAFNSVNCIDWNTFINKGCTNNTQVSMGYWLPNTVPNGNYYLKTSDKAVYALGNAGI